MLNARIKQKLKGASSAKATKPRTTSVQSASTKPRKPVSSMSTKPVVLNKRRAGKQETIVVQPAPRPVKPKPERKVPTMPIPQTQPVESILPPPPAVLEPVVIPPQTLISAAPAAPEPVLTKSVMPKVDVEPVVFGSYFSIQILRCESYRDVAAAVLTAADQQGVLFRKLQVLDIMAVGTTAFVRFRSDMLSIPTVSGTPSDLDKVLKALTNRSQVAVDPATGGYVVRFQDGRRGKYPTSTMNASAKLGFGQTFAGTRIKLWASQFTQR